MKLSYWESVCVINSLALINLFTAFLISLLYFFQFTVSFLIFFIFYLFFPHLSTLSFLVSFDNHFTLL